MQIIYAPRALRELVRLPRSAQERIVRKIHWFAAQTDPLRFAEHLHGYPAYRFRIGIYRVIFEARTDTLHILKIGKRNKIYDDL